MRYLLIIFTISLLTSCEKFGCECGEVISECSMDLDGYYHYTVKNQCSGNIRDFKSSVCGKQFEYTNPSNLIDANQNVTKIYCHDTPW
jgi:hypothetical protein